MILRGIGNRNFHDEVMKGLDSFIPKEGDVRDLNNWRPITLLPVIYNFFAKTLQTKLQPMLKDVISPWQTVFLPLRFILDNIMLTQESQHLARISRHPTVFLKLDFLKAYDKVSWKLFFNAMSMIGINEQYIRWV